MMEHERAAIFIAEAAATRLTGVLYNVDVDGIAAGVIAYTTMKRLGHKSVAAIPLPRGAHAHAPEVREQLLDADLSRLIVVDTGSRAGEILPGVPTLIIDHHRPLGVPQAQVFVSAHAESPPRPTSIVVYGICSSLTNLDDLEWVAALGALSDMGPRAPFPILQDTLKRYGRRCVAGTVVMLNAGHRHQQYRVDLAFEALLFASEPSDIAQHKVEGADRLEALRREVQDEF